MKTSAYAFEQIEVADKVVGLAKQLTVSSNDHKPESVFISVESHPIRFRYDGGDPTSTLGHLVHRDRSFEIKGQLSLQKFKAVSANDNPAILSVTYEGE